MASEVIGLTGYYCSGKSTVENILSESGWIVVDMDKVGHAALENQKFVLAQTFGNEIINNDGHVDRKALGKIVFADKSKLNTLNGIVHPVMIDMLRQKIAETDGKLVVSAAILFDMGLDALCSRVLVVKAPILTIIRRAKKRDGYKLNRIMKVLKSQKLRKYLRNEKVRVIRNSGSLERLRNTVEKNAISL